MKRLIGKVLFAAGILLLCYTAGELLRTHIDSRIENELTEFAIEQDLERTFGVSLPQGTALFETSLQDRITSSDTSLTLVSTSTASGEALANGYQCFTIDEGRTDSEFVCGTLGGSKTVSSLERGLSYLNGTTTVSANQYAHRKGANVKTTDFPLIQRMRNQTNGEETFPNLLSYANTVLIGVGSPTTTIATKYYVDNVVVAGGSDANETTKGIVELSTAAEAAAGTSAGGTAARLVLPASLATSTPTASCSAFCVVMATAGKVSQSFLDLTQHFILTSLFATSASTTNATTTNLSISSITSSLLKTNAGNAVVAAVAGTDYGAAPFLQSTASTTSSGTATTTVTLRIPANTLSTGGKEVIGDIFVAAVGNNAGRNLLIRIGNGSATTTLTDHFIANSVDRQIVYSNIKFMAPTAGVIQWFYKAKGSVLDSESASSASFAVASPIYMSVAFNADNAGDVIALDGYTFVVR